MLMLRDAPTAGKVFSENNVYMQSSGGAVRCLLSTPASCGEPLPDGLQFCQTNFAGLLCFTVLFESVTAASWQGHDLQHVLFWQSRMNSDTRGQIPVADVASCCSCSQWVRADSHQQTSGLGKMLQCCMKQKQPSLGTSCQADLCR